MFTQDNKGNFLGNNLVTNYLVGLDTDYKIEKIITKDKIKKQSKS